MPQLDAAAAAAAHPPPSSDERFFLRGSSREEYTVRGAGAGVTALARAAPATAPTTPPATAAVVDDMCEVEGAGAGRSSGSGFQDSERPRFVDDVA